MSVCVFCVFFFVKQKTAYELRISDWSSDVCSSDLISGDGLINGVDKALKLPRLIPWSYGFGISIDQEVGSLGTFTARANFNHRDLAYHTENNRGILPGADMVDASLTLDRKRVGSGQSVSGRVDLGGGRRIKTNKATKHIKTNIYT